MNSNAKILRNLINSKSIVKVGGAYDAMSAKLVENSGFDAIWAGSFAISAINAVPDASILTMTEFFDAASKMVNACTIPVIADCDTGYGGPSNVIHLVKKYENAGIAAISIEDKIFPKQNSLLKNGTNTLISEKDFVGKIIAAKSAKKDQNFMIIARIEALIANLGMNEALRRADAYQKAGADAILIHSKKETASEIFEFSKLWKGNLPLIVVPTTYGSVKINELINNKIKLVIYANQTLRSSHAAMTKLLKELVNAQSISEIKEEMSSMEDIFQLQNMYSYNMEQKELEKKTTELGY